ncbi:MAG: HDOD domain-containing protein [Methylococcales bacterium]|nr:HDOD domain-containing protein [Methylococcales bacterium]
MFNKLFGLLRPSSAPNRPQDADSPTLPVGAASVKPPIALLRQRVPLNELPFDQLQRLTCYTVNYQAGQTLYQRDSACEHYLYLIKGRVYLESQTGSGLSMEADSLRAHYPLATEQTHFWQAIAETPVQVLFISREKVSLTQDTPVHPEHWPVSEAVAESDFYQSLLNALQRNQIELPRIPDVAIKVRQAAAHDASVGAIAKIINLDPGLSASLLHIVNSPLYRAVKPMTRCLDAVNRLGIDATRNLVTSLSLKSLFNHQQPALRQHLQKTWLTSIQTASIAHVLAHNLHMPGLDPDEALLAGLLHNIGNLPLLTHAQQHVKTEHDTKILEQALRELSGPLGSYILHDWHFPDVIGEVPTACASWFGSSSDTLNLVDIVTLSRYHQRLQGKGAEPLPLLNTLPCFQKLPSHSLTPELSLLIIKDSEQDIAATLALFRN